MAQTVLLKTCTCSDYCHSTPQVFFLQVYSHTFSRIEKSAMASPRVILVMIEMCECDESPAVWLESRLWCWRCSEVESSGSFGNNFVATCHHFVSRLGFLRKHISCKCTLCSVHSSLCLKVRLYNLQCLSKLTYNK